MRVLGIDFGDVRTGFALSDPTGLLAQSLGTFISRDMEAVVQKAVDYCKQYTAETIVLGFPKNMNNTLGPRAEKSQQLKARLEELLPAVPVVLWDERGTTVSAIGYLNEQNVRGKKRKQVVDSVAAVIILQSYLDSLR